MSVKHIIFFSTSNGFCQDVCLIIYTCTIIFISCEQITPHVKGLYYYQILNVASTYRGRYVCEDILKIRAPIVRGLVVNIGSYLTTTPR